MEEPEQVPTEVRTRLTRSNFCRSFRVDGAWGSVTPQLGIHMALFAERWNVPNETIIKVDRQSGRLMDMPDPDKTDWIIIREVEADVLLTEEAAIFLRDWLSERIAQVQEQRAARTGQQG